MTASYSRKVGCHDFELTTYRTVMWESLANHKNYQPRQQTTEIDTVSWKCWSQDHSYLELVLLIRCVSPLSKRVTCSSSTKC